MWQLGRHLDDDKNRHGSSRSKTWIASGKHWHDGKNRLDSSRSKTWITHGKKELASTENQESDGSTWQGGGEQTESKQWRVSSVHNEQLSVDCGRNTRNPTTTSKQQNSHKMLGKTWTNQQLRGKGPY